MKPTHRSTAKHEAAGCAVEVTGLRKAFGEQTVLNGIDLAVAEGKTLAVLGRSGTGKSVLLKLLVGLQKPDAGTIQICGRPIQDLPPRELNEIRKKIGFLFQQAALYDSMTVSENVEFPLARHTGLSASERQDKVRQLLSDLGLGSDLDKTPSQISGGMQKRVGLARALALDPELLLLDEPTAGLDPITSEEIGTLISDLKAKRKITSVMVTHDIRATKQFADRLVLLNEGNIVLEGSFKDLQRSDDRFISQFMSAA
jgi:phospholipid/cholesterol/gamma-HCH transport system ATP-binding protein